MKKYVFLFVVFPLTMYGFGKNKVQYYSYQWKVATSPYFELHITEEQTSLVPEIMALLHQAYEHHKQIFNFEPKKKITVILYPNQIDFLKNNIIPWTERGTEGFTELSRGRIAIYYTPRHHEMRHYIFHELAHVFQISLWLQDRITSINMIDIPLWVVEGSAEWASVKITKEGDRYVANLLYRGKLPSLRQLANLYNLEPYQYYLVYKMGALFYEFGEQKWGNTFFTKLMNLIATKRSWKKILTEDFNTSEETLDREFREFLSRRYFPFYPKTEVPAKIHEKESFEAHILWINDHEFITMGIDRYSPAYILYNTNSQTKKVLDKMGMQEQNLYFQYKRNHLSKSTNGKVCWLVEGGDRYRLVLYNTQTEKKTIHTLPYRIFVSPDISPSGNEVVFVALENKNHVLAIYNIETKKTTVLFTSPFVMDSPRWYDEQHILLAANFHHGPESENMDLYLYDRRTKQWLWRIDSGESDEMPAIITHKGEKKILFISQDFFPSVQMYDPTKKDLALLYQAPGEISFPMSTQKDLYFTLYDEGTMALYRTSLSSKTNSRVFIEETPSIPPSSFPVFDTFSLRNYTWNLFPDTFLFFMAINSYGNFGLAGVFAGSDTLGDHNLFLLIDSVFVGAHPQLAGWNFETSYAFLKYRHQFGFRLLHYNNLFYEWIQFPDFYQVEPSYFDKWQIDGLYSYPFSTFQRIEASLSYRLLNYLLDIGENQTGTTIILTNNQNIAFTMAYVFDNTLDSGIGPLDGMRAVLSIEQTFPLVFLAPFATKLVFDSRGYLMIFPGYGFALRFAGGTIFNHKDHPPQLFYLGGFQSIRGYPYGSLRGDTALILNTEFRFPLIRYWQLGFPPLILPTIWGIFFTDGGGVVDKNTWKNFQGVDNQGKFKDIYLSVGWGLRLVFVEEIKLMWNVAYPYDGIRFYGPVQELVIARDF